MYRVGRTFPVAMIIGLYLYVKALEGSDRSLNIVSFEGPIQFYVLAVFIDRKAVMKVFCSKLGV